MTSLKSRLVIVIWPPGDESEGPPSIIVRIEADNPGATALQNALASIGPNSDATQIKQAITQGFSQLDVARVVPEPEMPASEAPKPVEPIVPAGQNMLEQPTKEVFDAAYAELDVDDKSAVDAGVARINVEGKLEYIE